MVQGRVRGAGGGDGGVVGWGVGEGAGGAGVTVDAVYGGRAGVGLVSVVGRWVFFFFSSRRRHTRSDRDWSSDVCSSDLEMVGYGSTADAFHVTEPPPEGAGIARAMRRALQKAGLHPDQVDYINAHGTSTPYNDRTETYAIKNCFAEHAYRVPISSTKSMIGHTIGAAGAIEAVV